MTQYTFPNQKAFLLLFKDYLTHHRQICFKIDNFAQIYFLTVNLPNSVNSIQFLSSQHVITSYGVRWWLQLIKESKLILQLQNITDILDCVDYAGYAMAALRLGQKNILFDSRSTQFKSLALRAFSVQANLVSTPAECFDMTPLRYKMD
ncbi:hypothetical protein COMNV_01027 [Commensalibacter sp. Nvir]|uniref:hypothetical protein n=1 Tax=Commensalibacter sp. Nvir TaxID=3069817 RepID=UPI002D4D5D9C|nr:hypothetical protein COMNV_01027 [Commensalibacter sp. Nvir]